MNVLAIPASTMALALTYSMAFIAIVLLDLMGHTVKQVCCFSTSVFYFHILQRFMIQFLRSTFN